jgi:uncharacterized protein
MPIPVGPILRDDATARFFDGTARGEFLIPRCPTSRAALQPQAEQCPSTGSTDLTWEAASGLAKVVSWTVLSRKQSDGLVLRGVFVIAELDEGPWWWSQLVDVEPEKVYEGQRLRIDFQRDGVHEAIPVFREA